MTKIMISANTAWNIYNFRMNLLKELKKNNFEVVVAAPPDLYVKEIIEEKIKFIPIKFKRKNFNIFSNLLIIFSYIKIFIIEKPDIYFSYTIKPNIFGSLAAIFFKKIKVYNNITGLGTYYFKKGIMRNFINFLYKISLINSSFVFFQNSTDQKYFIEKKIIPLNKAIIINGSGVDTDYFSYSEIKMRSKNNLVFLLISRLIFDKGLLEFIEAAKTVKNKYPKINFKILGSFDEDNNHSFDQKYFIENKKMKIFEHIEFQKNIKSYIIDSDCVVLPSYREGSSRVLLESASMGRPLIATDVPGCNNIVVDGINGYLCKPYNINSLVEGILKMINTNFLKRKEMGLNGRKKIISEFEVSKINDNILKILI